MLLLDISMRHQASRLHAAKTLSGGAPQAGAEVFCSARRWRWRGDSFNWLLIAICKITWAKCEIAVRGLAPSDAGKVLILPRPNYPLYQLGHFIFSTSVGTRRVSVRVNPWLGSSNIFILEKKKKKFNSRLRMKDAVENVWARTGRHGPAPLWSAVLLRGLGTMDVIVIIIIIIALQNIDLLNSTFSRRPWWSESESESAKFVLHLLGICFGVVGAS